MTAQPSAPPLWGSAVPVCNVAKDVRDAIIALTALSSICLQHSPTNYCFGLFDRLFMLVRGQTVYFGPASEHWPGCQLPC
jgi:hypothetical protein